MMKTSETRTIKRSQIHLNPYNPKRHSDEQVKLQLKNLKKNGYLGGIVWNSTTGNLVDGHRRIMALDLYNKYDGMGDYDVKVEVAEFDEKTEKEQMTYMAIGNSKADYNLIAPYVSEIDPAAVGLGEDDYNKLVALAGDRDLNVPVMDATSAFLDPMVSLKEDTKTSEEIAQEHREKPKMTAEQVKAEKANNDRIASDRQGTQDLYVFLSFDSFDQKATFCELLGYVPTNSMMVKGEDVMKLIE